MIKHSANKIRMINFLNKSLNRFQFSMTNERDNNISTSFKDPENSSFLNKLLNQKNSIFTSILSIGLAYNGNKIK